MLMAKPLEIPAYAEDGGEEAEVAGVYLIGDDGTPAARSDLLSATNFPITSSRRKTI